MKNSISFLILSFIINMAVAQSNFLKQGHRGCRGLMPENTIAAMKKAIDLGMQVLELDVVISKDKQVVVSHDTYFAADISLKPSGDTISTEEAKNYILYGMTYEEIKKYDVGKKHNVKFPQQENFAAYKPLLSVLIDAADMYAKAQGKPLPFYNIEIKSEQKTDGIEHPAPPEFVALVLAVLQNKNIMERMNIQSFDVRPLQLIHQQYPSIKLAYLTANKKTVSENIAELGFTPYFYSPYYKMVNRESVEFCHAQGMKIIPWTVNTKAEIEELKNLNVDGIITDYPNLF